MQIGDNCRINTPKSPPHPVSLPSRRREGLGEGKATSDGLGETPDPPPLPLAGGGAWGGGVLADIGRWRGLALSRNRRRVLSHSPPAGGRGWGSERPQATGSVRLLTLPPAPSRLREGEHGVAMYQLISVDGGVWLFPEIAAASCLTPLPQAGGAGEGKATSDGLGETPDPPPTPLPLAGGGAWGGVVWLDIDR